MKKNHIANVFPAAVPSSTGMELLATWETIAFPVPATQMNYLSSTNHWMLMFNALLMTENCHLMRSKIKRLGVFVNDLVIIYLISHRQAISFDGLSLMMN